MDIEEKRKQLTEQSNLLQEVKNQLKKEFIGLDSVIDKIAENVSSWMYFPEIQDRPIIINLWGLTGTGKTSLVKRLIELLGYAHRYYNFDMAESNDKYFDFQDKLDDIYDNCNGNPFIIGLDEFQHARTINEKGEEIEKAGVRDIWKLLDNGKLEIIRFDYNLRNLLKFIKKIDKALTEGVEVTNGVVVANQDIFKKIFEGDINLPEEEDEDSESVNDSKELLFVSRKVIEDYIFYLTYGEYILISDLEEKLKGMDGDEILDFLIDISKKASKPKLVDCSKSLVFIMGNLDEVYNMNKNFNPDINANEFYEQSLEITLPQVKNALLARFRSEQIARLGNTHIIYPALSEEAFYGILRMELGKIAQKILKIYNIHLEFDDTLEKFIYSEGVIPTQGTRPLFTTIQQILKSRLGIIIHEFYAHAYTATRVNLSISLIDADKENVSLDMSFYEQNKEVHKVSEKIPMDMGKLRVEKKDDTQALVAVHESGHVVLSCLLLGTVPQSVFSVTADSESSGFTFSKKSWKYISRKQIINQIALFLGGYMAEKLIFGAENVTLGSSSDLEMATQFVIEALYNNGMGDSLASYGNPRISSSQDIIYDDIVLGEKSKSLNHEAFEWIKQAERLAEETLSKQLNLLVALADYLSDNRFANKEQIKKLLDKYAIDFSSNSLVDKENADFLFYREHLKQKVKDLNLSNN